MATGLPSSDRRGPVYDKVTSFVTNMYIGHYERFHQCPDVLRKGFKGVIEIPYIPLRPSLQQQQQQQHQHQQQVQRQLSNGKRKAAVRPASSILFAGRMFLFGPERVCSVRTAIAMLASPSLRQEERGFTITVVNMTIPHVELGGKVVDKESVLHAEDAVTSLYLQHSFCIVSKGDSYSTSSLYTAIQSNCIPIVIGDWNVFAFNWIVAYDRFVIRISEENFLRSPERALTEAIRGIVNDKKRLREMRKEMRSWRRILNFGIEPWTGPASNQARKHLMEFSPSFRGIDVSSSGHGGTSTEYEVVLPLELLLMEIKYKHFEMVERSPTHNSLPMTPSVPSPTGISHHTHVYYFAGNESLSCNTPFHCPPFAHVVQPHAFDGFEKGGMLPDERSPLCQRAHGLIGMYKMVYFMGCVRILWPLRPGHFKPFDEKMLSQEEKNFVTEFHTIGFSPDIYPPLQNNVSSIVHFHSLLV